MGLTYGEEIMIVGRTMWTQCTSVTDGRTNRITITKTVQTASHGKNGAWAYLEIAQILGVPPIISGTGKATDYKFGGYIYRVNLNKSLLKIFEKRERGSIQRLSKFLGTPYYLRNG